MHRLYTQLQVDRTTNSSKDFFLHGIERGG